MVYGTDTKGGQCLINDKGPVGLPREPWVRGSYDPAGVAQGSWTRLKEEQASIL